MISSKIITKLQSKLPFIIDGFGGATNFIIYVKEFLDIPIENNQRNIPNSKYQEFINYFHTLFKYKKDIIMISPWAMYVDLRDILVEDLTSDSINPNLSYQVYDIKGNLKYTVTNHLGIFGESRLDENLINKARNAAIYFLKYRTFSGSEKVKLLIINMFSRQIRASNQNFSSPIVNTSSTLTINKTSNGSVNVYLVAGAPQPISNINVNNFRRPETLSILNSNEPIYYSISEGSWLLIDHEGATVLRSVVTNVSNDVVVPVVTSPTFTLYYIGLNTDVAFLNQHYKTSLTSSNKPITETITVE